MPLSTAQLEVELKTNYQARAPLTLVRRDTAVGQPAKLCVKDLNFYYGTLQVLHNISVDIETNRTTAFIGPSGCGKSTFLRTLNRMHEEIPGARAEGEVLLDGASVFDQTVSGLRRSIGMVFQKSTPFPRSIFENVAYGLRLRGTERSLINDAVERSLRRANLWEEVKDKLNKPGSGLSGGQQQRLCIARALAVSPEVLLLDEPCSALDPIGSAKIEDLLLELKATCTIVIVTHNMQQAARVSDYSCFFLSGRLIEFNDTKTMFETPSNKLTEDYITGRFG